MPHDKPWIFHKGWQHYTVALGVTTVSLGLIGLLNSLTGLSFFQLSLFAVVVTALYGGFWPAVLSALVSAVAIEFFFMDPRFAFGLDQWGQGVQLLVFASLAVTIAALGDSRRRAMEAWHMRTAELEVVNEELRTFTQLVSHDIRRPLRVIDGYAHILRTDHAGVLSEVPQRYLSAISNASQQIALLVTQLLDLSKIGRQPLQMEQVDVAALAREAIENLKVEWENGQVDFMVHPLPRCRADRQLLKQALLNLLDNALKFSRGRSPAHIDRLHDRGEGYGPITSPTMALASICSMPTNYSCHSRDYIRSIRA